MVKLFTQLAIGALLVATLVEGPQLFAHHHKNTSDKWAGISLPAVKV